MTRLHRRGAALGRSRSSQRGAAALELALILPVLAALLFGIVDYGDLLVRQGAASSSIRIAAVRSFDSAAERSHDLDVVSVLVTELHNRGLDDVRRVVIHDADVSEETPASCLTTGALASGGVTGLCVVYGPAILSAIADGTADAYFDDPACAGDADGKWCPADRPGAVAPLDGWKVGIFVEARHGSPTGVVPQLRGYDIEESVVVHLWDRTASV